MKRIKSWPSSRVHRYMLTVMRRLSDRRSHLLDRPKFSLQGDEIGLRIVVGGLPHEDVWLGAREPGALPELEARPVFGRREKPGNDRVTLRAGRTLNREVNHQLLNLPPHRAAAQNVVDDFNGRSGLLPADNAGQTEIAKSVGDGHRQQVAAVSAVEPLEQLLLRGAAGAHVHLVRLVHQLNDAFQAFRGDRVGTYANIQRGEPVADRRCYREAVPSFAIRDIHPRAPSILRGN